MRIITLEESQTVTNAFREAGHEAWSCDLKPCSGGHPQYHIQGDIFDALRERWDMGIFHPPCTYLTVTGNKWFYHPEDKDLPFQDRRPHPKFPDRREKQEKAVQFFMNLVNCGLDKWCIENPVGIMSKRYRKPNQIIQPMYFGHKEPKRTCLWLRGLPRINGNVEYALDPSTCEPEYHVTKSGKRMPKWYAYADKSQGQEKRAEIRSKTFEGIAAAMVKSWG